MVKDNRDPNLRLRNNQNAANHHDNAAPEEDKNQEFDQWAQENADDPDIGAVDAEEFADKKMTKKEAQKQGKAE